MALDLNDNEVQEILSTLKEVKADKEALVSKRKTYIERSNQLQNKVQEITAEILQKTGAVNSLNDIIKKLEMK